MPIGICNLSSFSIAGICKVDFQTSLSKGYYASQKLHFHGYKLHAVCSASCVFSDFEFTQATVHDIYYLKNLKTNFFLVFSWEITDIYVLNINLICILQAK